MFAITVTGPQCLRYHGSRVLSVALVNNYSTDLKPYNLTSLKRGTGGRSSFNGVVATVFGATGFVGRYVCNRLGKIGSQLIIPYRGDHYDVMRLKVVGDLGQVLFTPYHLADEESIRKACKYSNVVINLVGRDWETKNFKFDDVHVKGARRLARIAKEMGVERFIHLSALNNAEHITPIYSSKGSQFLMSKWHGEQTVLEEFPKATIIRPADIYGSEDRFLRFYIHFWRRQGLMMPIWKSGEFTIKQPVYVGDVATAIMNALKDPETAGKIYQAAGPKRYYLSDLVDWFYNILRKGEDWGFRRYDARFDPLFRVKLTMTGMLPGTPVANLHWERIERECISDDIDYQLPTLEDLGVTLTRMEDQVPWELRPFTRSKYAGLAADEPYPQPEAPRAAV